MENKFYPAANEEDILSCVTISISFEEEANTIDAEELCIYSL